MSSVRLPPSPAVVLTSVLAGVLAAAFNLRISVAAVGPLIEQIRADTGMSAAVAGLLTMLPFLCMGLFAFAGPPLVQRLGARTVIALALALITGGTLLRSAMPGPSLIVAATLPIGIGIALIGVTLPVVVKRHFPLRAGAVSGGYVASLSVGTAAVGFGTVPLASALGGWREALAVTALPAAMAIPFWIGRRDAGDDRPGDAVPGAAPMRVRRALPSRTALLFGVMFGLQSGCFAAMLTWAPAIYAADGWSETQAAWTTSGIGLMTILASLTVPRLSDGGDRRPALVVILIITGIGAAGAGLFATTAGWLWIVLFGFGTGATFPLLLALPLDVSDDPAQTAELTTWTLGLGYGLASIPPIFVGAMHDLTGEFTIALTLVGVSVLGAAVLAALAPPPRSAA